MRLAQQRDELKKQLSELRQRLQKANAEERRLSKHNTQLQLENYQHGAQRNVLISSLADAQQRIHNLRAMKERPCGCGRGIKETEETGLPLVDDAVHSL